MHAEAEKCVLLLMTGLDQHTDIVLGRSSQILKSKQCNPLICDFKEGHKASTQAKFQSFIYNIF